MICLCFCCIMILTRNATLYSQNTNIAKLLKNNTENFHEVQNIVRNNKEIFNNASDKEKKMYQRWVAFWSSRIDSSGDLNKYAVFMKQH